MIPTRFEYAFILTLFALTGLTVTWEGVALALKRRHGPQAIALFFLYCFAIEIIALSRGWWTFNDQHVIGLYVWRVPIEELLLFAVFSLIVLGAWETLQRARD